MIRIIKSILTEYGLIWALNRGLYSMKLRMMTKIPYTEKLFEKKVLVKRIDIFNFDIISIRDFLLKLDDKKKDEIISIADKAINGVITGFSSIELNYGNPIDWHFNSLTGFRRRSDIKWYCIPDFDSKAGDIKVIWEASRLTHFLYFTRAYLLTEDVKYYYAFSNQLEEWLKSNLYSFGTNYKCGQEAALRMINVLMAFSVFSSSGVTTDSDRDNVIKIVEGSYKKILSNFFYAHKCIKNNHTFSEILGRIVGAWCCEDESEVTRSYKLMDKEIKRQFFNDGGFIQYSFNYQRFTLQIMECLYKVSEKTGQYILEKDRLIRSVLLLFQVQEQNGDVANYGSNDGALIFPLSSCGYRDFRPVLNTVYALLEGKRLYGYGDYDEELLWFGCKKELPYANITKQASCFNNSGIYTLCHDGGFLMTCLQDFKSRPAHMDQLHIDLWHNGVNVFCDSGTYSYASDIEKEFSFTAGHNTAKLNGIEQMNKKGKFLVTDWTKRIDVKHTNESFLGTMFSKNGYKHSRNIIKTNYGYLITDEVFGNGDYCEFNFHTPCEVEIDTNIFRLLNNGETICTVKVSEDILVKKAYRSLYYLTKEDISCVSIRHKMTDRKCRVEFNIEL